MTKSKVLKRKNSGGSKVKKHRAFLTYAASLPSVAEQRKLFKIASGTELKSICEICTNVKNGRLPMSKLQRARLCLYKRQIRCMANRKISIDKKRKLLSNGNNKQQKGGFIGTLLGITLPLLASIIGRATSSK